METKHEVKDSTVLPTFTRLSNYQLPNKRVRTKKYLPIHVGTRLCESRTRKFAKTPEAEKTSSIVEPYGQLSWFCLDMTYHITSSRHLTSVCHRQAKLKLLTDIRKREK